MLHSVDEVTVGQTLWTFPHTKSASTNVHRQLAVRVLQPPAKFWPYLVVGWAEGKEDKWEKVHKDDLKKKQSNTTASSDKHQGDSVGSDGSVAGKWQRRLALPGRDRVKPTEDQLELW